MRSVGEALADPTTRRALVSDAARLVESEVASKRGMRGAALRAGFKAFKAVKPGILEDAVDKLLPHFAPAIDPMWEQARQTDDPEAWLNARDGELADKLLAVTDGLAQRANSRVLVRIYKGLRGQAREHVVAAVPGLARLMVRRAVA